MFFLPSGGEEAGLPIPNVFCVVASFGPFTVAGDSGRKRVNPKGSWDQSEAWSMGPATHVRGSVRATNQGVSSVYQ